jgi:hypothetical protein
MPQSLPQFQFEIRQNARGSEVWDGIRKQWLVMTPEEHVRQCLVRYLTETCGVPKGLISLERGLQYDRRRKRYDLLIYDRAGRPFILCECKEPRVPIDDAVVHQISLYNSKIGARILLLTNGPQLVAFAQTTPGKWTGLAMPDPDLAGGEAWFDEAERILG